MAAIPSDVETDQQPPMTIPLRHFVVAVGFLLGGVLAGSGLAADAVPGLGALAHVHLLLVGWVCLTIMGAMTQFVPVWSGVALHSRRLASAQLTLVTVGLVGFAAALLHESLAWLAPFGVLVLAGFWAFAYNVGRTLASLDSRDATERHFLIALGFFVALTTLGLLLAVDFTGPVFASVGLERSNVAATHATLAVFGAVLTTVYGALYQLGTMFTQTELHGVDDHLQTAEAVGHPVGVVLLAGGRLLDVTAASRLGALLVVAGALAVAAILGRKLVEMRVPRTPMHTRYAVAAVGLAGWALLTTPAWLRAPNAPAHALGAAGATHLLVLGGVGFVVFGTLYHVVPFIIWVHRYSDRLGFEEVPMIDDLYDDRLAAVDGALLAAGTLLLVLADLFRVPAPLVALGGALVTLGVVVFSANVLFVIRTHSPQPLGRILLGSLYPRPENHGTADGAQSKSR